MTSSRNYGFTGSILLLIPMLIIPGMAVFGVPQFLPVVASAPAPESQRQRPGFRETRVGESAAAPASFREFGDETLDIFRPQAQDHPQAASPRSATVIPAGWMDPLQTRRTVSATTDRRPALFKSLKPRSRNASHSRTEKAGRLSPSPTVPDTSPAATGTRYVRGERSPAVAPEVPAPTPSVTWRDAASQLNQLGVRTYRLTPGQHSGEFRFMCYVTSADDPRISRRFEAASTEPLHAVVQVIQEISDWKQGR